MATKTGKIEKITSKDTWLQMLKKQSADWDGWLRVDSYPWSNGYTPITLAAVSRDNRGLNVYMRSYETKIRFEGKKRNDFVCQDSCMEFFFAPMGPENLAYFNFELNPCGVAYIGFSPDGTRAGSIQAAKDRPDSYFDIQAMHTEEAKAYNEKNGNNPLAFWELAYTVPYELINEYLPEFNPELPGKRIAANFYKCGDLTDTLHYGSWNPLTSESPDFHRPGDFGILQFA